MTPAFCCEVDHHPTKKERMHFDSELPKDFQAAVDKLRGWAEYQEK
ncbi:MAG: hypothetical protein AAF655_21930 [Bacteroidota bacterium]